MTKAAKNRFKGLAAAALCLACVIWLAISTVSPPAIARQGPSPGPDPMQTLARLLEPAAWAVSGISPEQAQAALAAVASAQAEVIASMHQDQAQTEAFAEQLASADDVLQRGGATQARLAARDTAQAGFEASSASYRSTRAALKAAVIEAIAARAGASNAAMAERWSRNAVRKVPDALKSLDLDDEGWRRLEATWRRTLRGEDLAGAEAAALAAAQQDSSAVSAEQRLTNDLPAIGAWLSTIATE